MEFDVSLIYLASLSYNLRPCFVLIGLCAFLMISVLMFLLYVDKGIKILKTLKYFSINLVLILLLMIAYIILPSKEYFQCRIYGDCIPLIYGKETK